MNRDAIHAGQLLAYLAHGHTRPVGDDAYIGDRYEQGVLPEVVGLPPDDLLERVRLGSSVSRRHRQDSELELALVWASERALGQEPIRYPSRATGSARLAPHRSSASAPKRRNTSPAKVPLRGCKGASSLTIPKMSASRDSPPIRIRRAVTAYWAPGACWRTYLNRRAEPSIASGPWAAFQEFRSTIL